MGFDAGRVASDLGENLFICTNFFDGCEGDITIGNPQTCTINNALVSTPIPPCEVTIDTITGVGDVPVDIAYDQVNERMYVTNYSDGTVSVIDTTSNTVIDTISVGNNPHLIAYEPINQDMYVINQGDNTVSN